MASEEVCLKRLPLYLGCWTTHTGYAKFELLHLITDAVASALTAVLGGMSMGRNYIAGSVIGGAGAIVSMF